MKKSTIDTIKYAINLSRTTKDLQKTTMRSTIDLNRTTIVLEQKLKAKEWTAIDHKLYKNYHRAKLEKPKRGTYIPNTQNRNQIYYK